jgi:hypothetical protein
VIVRLRIRSMSQPEVNQLSLLQEPEQTTFLRLTR